MRRWSRLLSLFVGLGIFAWLQSHAGGFNPDGSPADPNPPPLYLMMGGLMLGPLLIVYATGGFRTAQGGSPDDAATAAGQGSGE